MEKEEFLSIVSKFDRKEFRRYLYKSPNIKSKLISVLEMFDEKGNKIKPIIPNDYKLYYK